MNKFFKNGLFASNSIFFTITPAAAAKLLQSCLTLCDPVDGSLSYQAPCPWDSTCQEYWSGFPFPSPVHESEK